ncbi:hypothetical protein LPB140_02090 [Sphingorhabdus lutea]|uniref:Peptidase S8/S53 domain-containing protein n=1 Tax=Sphingorhabdus lutea TaxID=1913578 RepID=A0A1L3J9N3_9SPHN|nr:S8 family peptidase [Sphingorhabdus lutea]APG61821.1 hypothetical protein LPB140_02090 [Sphingorhabdus lutea]
MSNGRKIAIGTSIIFALATSACGGSGGGGGGGVVTSPPAAPVTPPASPTPPPPPPPPPTNFVTSEYNRSDGPSYHNALPAYQLGASGQGVIAAIIDSGIDPDSHEFTGRISPLSGDVTNGGRGISFDSDHGTRVARVLAAARDDRDTMGIAFNATILALRADTPGSCTTPEPGEDEATCSFSDTSIAEGINRAITAGARVINISLGGAGTANSALRNAVQRATQAGIVIVVSAGNEYDEDEPDYDINNPSPFAQALVAQGNGLVIISTSVNDERTISDFSNRAGTSQNVTLSALGDRICCVYENDAIKRTTENGQSFVFVYNGTSFSAPQISGAVALLAQYFPNLTGAQIVQLLLNNADDVGAAGTDNIYGRGILNIGRAFAPTGTTSIADTKIALPLDQGAGSTSGPMGDASSRDQSAESVVLDAYGRAYNVNIAHGLRADINQLKLTHALNISSKNITASAGPINIGFAIARDEIGAAALNPLKLSQDDAKISRILAGRISAKIAKDSRFTLAIRQEASTLALDLKSNEALGSFLVAPSILRDSGFFKQPLTATSISHDWRGISFTGFAENGYVAPTRNAEILRRISEIAPFSDGYNIAGLDIAGSVAGFDWHARASILNEEKSLLGARLSESLVNGGAQSMFADAQLGRQFAGGWSVSASSRFGWTRPNAGTTTLGSSMLKSNAFSLDVNKSGFITGGDLLSLRFAQPLRISSGTLSLNLPLSYDYSTRSAVFGLRDINLAPQGRELISELSWQSLFGPVYIGSNIYWRQQPGHFKNAPDDLGVAVRMNMDF